MENTLTKKQAEAMLLVCRQWKAQISLITEQDSCTGYFDWKWQLKHISYIHTLPVDISELYSVMNDLCIALSDKIDKGELK